MANYLAGVLRKRVAVLEWNSHGDFACMAQFCGARRRNSDMFRVLEVDYIGAAGARELAACLSARYQYVIIDFGEITEASFAECARCEKKVMIGSLSEWRAGVFLEEAGETMKQEKGWSYAAAFGSEESRNEWEKAFHCPCLRIPASEDAFAVTRADMRLFEVLLN